MTAAQLNMEPGRILARYEPVAIEEPEDGLRQGYSEVLAPASAGNAENRSGATRPLASPSPGLKRPSGLRTAASKVRDVQAEMSQRRMGI